MQVPPFQLVTGVSRGGETKKQRPPVSTYIDGAVEGGRGSDAGAASHVQSDADGRLPYPLFTVACQLVLQVLGLQLQLGPLLDLLLALSR